MSELWICREQTAVTPFRIEKEGPGIITVEELCYYLYHNIYFLEEGLMDQALFSWLRQELALPRLAAVLEDGRRKGRNAVWCALMILREAGFYTEEELKELELLSREMSNKSEFECGKLKADHLLKNGKIVGSIRIYERLLNENAKEGGYPILIGNIWHNLGVAHARLFLFAEAAEFFQTAYAYNQKPESRQAYQEALACKEAFACDEATEAAKALEGEGALEDGSAGWEKTGMQEYLMNLREDYKRKVMEYGTV